MATMRDCRIFLRLFLCCTWINFIDGIELTSSISDYLNLDDVDVDVWHLRDTRVAIRDRRPLDCEKPEVYICEEPLETIPPEVGKTCNYRNVRYHEQVYRWVAGRGCLLYTPNFLFIAGANPINLNAGCYYGESYAPCLEFAKSDGSCGCYPFDPGLEVVAAAVREALIPSAQGRWESCFHTASDCCSHYMSEEPNTTNNQCETSYDGWTCWTEVEGGMLATEVCPEFAYSNNGPTCQHFSSKQCFANGTWQLQTDYATCSVTPRLLQRYRFYIGMLAFSIASCVPAVFIFFLYKRLRIKRVILHRNLLIAIIVRNIFVIVSRSVVYIDELTNTGDTVMSLNGVACRILAFGERFAGNMVFACMLVEGIYLHRTIVTVFRRELQINLLYGIGFVIALVPTISWAAVMAVSNDHSCWVVYTVPNIQWILDAPRVFILLINTCLFVDVLRVLLTKIRNTENANQLNTAKAALFLMPLFGTQFLFTVFRPNTTECSGEDIYYYIAYTIEGLQGFIVAMLYCYINKEVIVLIKATYKKTENAVVSRIRDSNYPRVSVLPSTDRMTCSTAMPSTGDVPREQYNPIGSKLHVAEITSIQATERLADILDPIYETIHQNGATNEGYDSLDRSDNDSGFIPNTESKVEEYYGFTNESSISIDCQDWIRCISSPSSSVYNNSLNDYETKYLEKKFPHHPKLTREIKPTIKSSIYFENNSVQESIKKDSGSEKQSDINDIDDECVDYKMLDEILQYIETNEIKTVKDPLNSNSFSPNRQDEDKIVFVNE